MRLPPLCYARRWPFQHEPTHSRHQALLTGLQLFGSRFCSSLPILDACSLNLRFFRLTFTWPLLSKTCEPGAGQLVVISSAHLASLATLPFTSATAGHHENALHGLLRSSLNRGQSTNFSACHTLLHLCNRAGEYGAKKCGISAGQTRSLSTLKSCKCSFNMS